MQLPLTRPVPGTGHADDDPLPEPGEDFVSLDESGEFSYHPTAQALLSSFDLPAEVVCIVDRNGIAYGLQIQDKTQGRVQDKSSLSLGRPLGRVDFHWLRQTWLRTQKLRPQSYPLHRLPPASTFSLLRGMFEALQLETNPCRSALPWTVSVDDRIDHPLNLNAVDDLLTGINDLERVSVQDPFGHQYLPVRYQSRRFLASGAGYIYYLERPSRPE